MDNYLGKYSGITQGKRYNKAVVVIVSIIAVMLVILMTVGIIVGSDNERSKEISTAIEENTQLKQLVEEQQEQIEELTAENEKLKEIIPEDVMETYENGTTQTEPTQYPSSPRDEMN